MLRFRHFCPNSGLLMCVLGLVGKGPAMAAPVITTNTLPGTAVDVVGSSVKFTAGFNSAFPISYQWQVIRNGTTNNLSSATNTTLTLSNLQTNDTGSYRLRATDSQGATFSAARSLAVNPSLVEGSILSAFASQTGLGSGGTNFFPTWNIIPGNLIGGQSPSGV